MKKFRLFLLIAVLMVFAAGCARKDNPQGNAGDASSIKEYMAYWLFGKTGTDAPLASYAWLTVNGEDQGLFTVLEGVEDSFLASKGKKETKYEKYDRDQKGQYY